MSDLNFYNTTPDGLLDVMVEIKDTSVFKKGAIISIKHRSIFEPFLSIIQKVEGNKIFFKISDIFIKNNVLKGDYLSCHVMQDHYEYVFYGMITDIDINYPWFVEVELENIKKFKNNRKSKRYLVNFQSKIIPQNLNGGIYAIIKNISMTGVSTIFKENISKESLINVTVSASINKTLDLEFIARVTRVIKREIYNEYGLEITKIDDKNKDILEKLIYSLECDESLFIVDSFKL
ncbi:UNVERIFIED_CONTAM: PilZ domain-containing protein [Acetivibrio alkalicellulosi]